MIKTTVDMRYYDTTKTKKYDPNDLSPNQQSIYVTIGLKPRKYAELYKIYKDIMPESSVRRIMASLLAKDLAVKMKSGRWRQVKVE